MQNRKLWQVPSILPLALAALLLAACGGGGGDDEGGASNSINPISSSASAENVAKDIVEACLEARRGLANGTHSGTVVNGNSGTATVTGIVSFQSGISCGSDCVRSENNTGLVIVFDNYVINTASNTTTTLNGSISFSDTTFSRQSGLSFSSGGSLSAGNNTNISYELIGTDAAGTFGTRDTVTSVASSGRSVFSQQGSLSTASGGAFTF